MTPATQFDWADHDRKQAQIVADLYESIARWRAAAEAFRNQPVLYRPERENV